MTFHDLRKWLNSNNINHDEEKDNNVIAKELKLTSEQFSVFRDKPFYILDIEEHKRQDIINKGACCFNHLLGLPRKDGVEHKIYDYEMQLANALDNNKSVFVKKSRGLGITEILLRYMAWLAVRNNDYSGCRFHVVTGPRINLAEELIDRIHGLFMNSKSGGEINCKQVGPIIYVNNVIIQAFLLTLFQVLGDTQM
jgi:hypothetical protein